MELSRYIDGVILVIAREINRLDALSLQSPMPGAMRFSAIPSFAAMTHLDPGRAFAFFALAKTLKGGAKVINLPPKIARVFLAVDLNLTIEDYVQPYEAVGVVIPAATIGRKRDVIANLFWRPEIGFVMGCFLGQSESNHFNITPGMGKTIEEILSDPQFCSGMTASDQMENRNILRIAMNACLFAVERGVKPERVDRKARQRRNAKTKSGNAVHARVIEIQNLDLFLKPSSQDEGGGEGIEHSEGRKQAMHRRRGHWKMQAFGPGRSQRRPIFVHSYMVHSDPSKEVGSIIS
jgi:hypothetical protein